MTPSPRQRSGVAARIGHAVAAELDGLAGRVVSHRDVSALLERALPERPWRLARVAERRAIPTRRQRVAIHVAKTLLYLVIYYSGLWHLLRALRRITGRSRACVLLYHRVNDVTDDPLTTDVRRFAEHLVAIREHYAVLPTSTLVEAVQSGRTLPRPAVVIHFDDCYRDVATHASPLLEVVEMPACCFVASGYVGTDRVFPHDATAPARLPNLEPQDLRDLVKRGFEIGSHTVNHVDLGRCPVDVATREIHESKRDLEAIVDRPVTLFSYPFGKASNIRADVVELIRQAGYEAVFSAHGGYVTAGARVFDLPRVGVSGRARPLDLLMEIEGLSLGALRTRWARWRS